MDGHLHAAAVRPVEPEREALDKRDGFEVREMHLPIAGSEQEAIRRPARRILWCTMMAIRWGDRVHRSGHVR